MIVQGDLIDREPNNRWETLKYYGLVEHTKTAGNFIYTPLGTQIKRNICQLVRDQFKRSLFIEIEMPNVSLVKELPENIRSCVTLVDERSRRDYYISDALVDGGEVKEFLQHYQNIFWVKKYIDTSRKVETLNLRFHSYELICVLSRYSVEELVSFFKGYFEGLFGSNVVYVRMNGVENYSIRIKNENSDITLAHIHKFPNESFSMCGISVEKLIYSILLHNISSARKIMLFNDVLITYHQRDFSSINEESYDFIDNRNLKLKEKVDRLNPLGIKKLLVLHNDFSIKEFK